MAEQLYQVIDEFPFQEKVTTYHGLTLQQAATRMDDLIDVGERTILEDWGEPCERCNGDGFLAPRPGERHSRGCSDCHGDGKWPGPWHHTDPDTGREVTMTREVTGFLPLCNPANRPGTLYERFYPMETTYDAKLKAAHAERGEILERIRGLFDDLRLPEAPTLTPFTSESSAPALAAAVRRVLEGDSGSEGLMEALSDAERPEGIDYGDHTTPVVVIPLAGLRALEGIFSELKQRREAEAAG